MSKRYYECHITLEPLTCTLDRAARVVAAMNWRFSAIDGDANLGSGVKWYATRQYSDRLTTSEVKDKLLEAALHLTEALPGIRVLRRKVELVLYDDRSSKVNCDDCAACQEARGP